MSEQEKKISPLGIENGPTQEEIDQWKTQFGDIYSVGLGSEKYIYRPMKRFEYKNVIQLSQSQENRTFAEEKIAQMCVVWPAIDPTKLSTLKAGTISTLVELIMAASNFGVTEEPVKL
jgi:hypothetical protein